MSSLLVFLTTFSTVFCISSGVFFLYLLLVPGGTGLIFANPLICSFFGGLVSGVIFTLNHIVGYSQRFSLTYALILLTCFLLFSFSFPLMLKISFSRSVDDIPIQRGHFLSLDDESKLYLPPLKKARPVVGQFLDHVVYIPADQGQMIVLNQAQYDPLNQRFLFSYPVTSMAGFKEVSPESEFFGLPFLIKALQLDFFKIYSVLKILYQTDILRFYLTVFCCCLFLLGLLPLFLLKSWPVLHWVLVLFCARLMVFFIAFCLWDSPAMISVWTSSTMVFQKWIPIFLLSLAGMILFLVTILTKPYKSRAL